MANLRVDQLITYPVKSLGGVSSTRVIVSESGFENDRRWMIVDSSGQPVIQREHPVLSRCKVRLQGEYITVSYRGDEVWLPLQPGDAGEDSIRVSIWGDEVEASEAPDEIGDWFSGIVGFQVRLVFVHDAALRPVDQDYAPGQYQTAFTDGFPILVATLASLGDLNDRLDEPIPISRFRPNLVISGGEAFEEDYWGEISVGDATIRGVKPCSRCVMTTIDETTAETGKEPLKTLATFRKWGSNVYFAENFVVEEGGRISVGDRVEVKSRRSQAEIAKIRA